MSGGDFKLGCNLLHIWGATSEKRAVGLAVLRFPVLALISTTDKVFFMLRVFTSMHKGGLCK